MARRYATKPFNLCQLGLESTAGTAVPATNVIRGPFGGFDDAAEQVVVEEEIGVQVSPEWIIETRQGSVVSMPAMPLTYEQAPYLGEGGVGQVTPTGAGPYVYAYAYPTDGSVQDVSTYTFEVGNTLVSPDVHEIPFCWLEEFTISGKQGEAWMMEGTWQGQQAVQTAFTSSIAVPAVEAAIFSDTSLYIDNSGGVIGTTPVTGVMLEFSMRVRTGIQWIPPGDGTRYSTNIKYGRPEITFNVRYELEADGAASVVATERAAYKSRAIRLFRLSCPGTNGRDMVLDFAGRYEVPGGYEEQEGNVNVNFPGRVAYSSTDALFWSWTLTNLLDVLL